MTTFGIGTSSKVSKHCGLFISFHFIIISVRYARAIQISRLFSKANHMAAHASEPERTMMSEDEVFQTVQKRNPAKRQRGRSSTNIENLNHASESYSSNTTFHTTSPNPNPKGFSIFITPIDRSKSLNNVNPIQIAKAIREVCVNPVDFIKTTNTGLLIKCKNTKQVKAISEINKIGSVDVKVSEGNNGAKGVIYDIPLEMKEEEILNELKTQNVIGVKRMVKRVRTDETIEGKRQISQIPMRCVILTFSKVTIPPEIHLCFQIKRVKQYVPPVIRCYQCQRFGHNASQCNSKKRCVRCGENHSFDECKRKEERKCVNCGENHSAAYSGCAQAKKAKQVQQIRYTKGLTYAEATQSWQQQNKKEPNPQPIQQKNKANKTSSKETEKQTNELPVQKVSKPNITYAQSAVPSFLTRTNTTPQFQNQVTPQVPQSKETINNQGTSNETPQGTPPMTNFIASASDEQIIDFICQLIFKFTEGRTEKELNTLVCVAAKRALEQNSTYDRTNDSD